MKQDLMLVISQTECPLSVCKKLENYGLNISQMVEINSVKAGLALHSPAFLLVDIDMAGAKQFIVETGKSILYPPPYIIIATKFSSCEDYFTMLNLGADACVSKPINVQEILAVVNAVFRREKKIARWKLGRSVPCIEYKDLIIDPLRRVVTMRGQSVALTAKEFDILCLLAQNSGVVLTKEKIFESVWKTEYGAVASNVSGHIFSIRQKLGLESKNNEYIQTVFGVGYRFAPTE